MSVPRAVTVSGSLGRGEREGFAVRIAVRVAVAEEVGRRGTAARCRS